MQRFDYKPMSKEFVENNESGNLMLYGDYDSKVKSLSKQLAETNTILEGTIEERDALAKEVEQAEKSSAEWKIMSESSFNTAIERGKLIETGKEWLQEKTAEIKSLSKQLKAATEYGVKMSDSRDAVQSKLADKNSLLLEVGEWFLKERIEQPEDSSSPKTFIESHRDECDHWADMDCTCGLDKLLERIQPAKDKNENL